MGVQFEPLPELHAAHLGLFWSRIRTEYPHTEDQLPLPPAKEAAEITPIPPSASITAISTPPPPRCWFLTGDKTELIQVQRDRFLRNWRQVAGNERYPHFEQLAQSFKRDWGRFLAFVEDEKLGSVNVNQCELTYINNIERGAGWSELGELDKVFPTVCPRGSTAFLPPPEMLSWQTRYKLPDGRGRLYIEMTPSFRGRDLRLVLALNLIARGASLNGSAEQIAAWFDLAHEWVVRAFTELTGSSVQELWERKS